MNLLPNGPLDKNKICEELETRTRLAVYMYKPTSPGASLIT